MFAIAIMRTPIQVIYERLFISVILTTLINKIAEAKQTDDKWNIVHLCPSELFVNFCLSNQSIN